MAKPSKSKKSASDVKAPDVKPEEEDIHERPTRHVPVFKASGESSRAASERANRIKQEHEDMQKLLKQTIP